MEIGFTVVCRDREAEFRWFGQPRAPGTRGRLLSYYAFSGQTAVLLGRLHYRREVLARLGATLPPELAGPSGSNDAALALAVYCREGRAGLLRLEGDFSLVVHDGKEHRLLALRDPLGAYPLFWTQVDAGLGPEHQPATLARPPLQSHIGLRLLGRLLHDPAAGDVGHGVAAFGL